MITFEALYVQQYPMNKHKGLWTNVSYKNAEFLSFRIKVMFYKSSTLNLVKIQRLFLDTCLELTDKSFNSIVDLNWTGCMHCRRINEIPRYIMKGGIWTEIRNVLVNVMYRNINANCRKIVYDSFTMLLKLLGFLYSKKKLVSNFIQKKKINIDCIFFVSR